MPNFLYPRGTDHHPTAVAVAQGEGTWELLMLSWDLRRQQLRAEDKKRILEEYDIASYQVRIVTK